MVMPMEKPMLSIYIPTYNHEKYIARALDSVLMQKTQYSYEVLVGEDVSLDGTRTILQEYEAKFPGKFTMFYREKNMHGTEVSNALDLKRRCRGKYIVGLEGDDFWTDENKLEKQITFLETHPEYLAVAHNCVVVGDDSLPNGEQYPECKDEEYTLRHFVSEQMPGQLTTVMYRNYITEPYMDTSLFERRLSPGDRLLYFALATHGKVFCMQEVMSAYRHVTTHGSSFSATSRYSFKKDEHWYFELMQYALQQSNKTASKYAQLLYFRSLLQGVKQRQITVREFCKYSSYIPKKLTTAWLYGEYVLRHHVLHKELWVSA